MGGLLGEGRTLGTCWEALDALGALDTRTGVRGEEPAERPPPQKPGKWCAVHVQIAWQTYHHQQRLKVSPPGAGRGGPGRWAGDTHLCVPRCPSPPTAFDPVPHLPGGT